MLIVLIIVGIMCLILLMFLAIALSVLKIEIQNLKIDAPPTKVTVEEYKIYIRLYLFGKIRLFSMKIDNRKAEEVRKWKIIKWIDKKIGIRIEDEIKDLSRLMLKERRRIFSTRTWRNIRELNIKISEFKMNVKVGLEDAIITSYLVALIASIISIALAYNVERFNKKKYSYKVTPVYINQNFLKMDLNCIINVKMVHIMNVIYLLLRKRSDKANDRTSNRRSYAHSYGQYPRHG